jgi:hypothetical protein
MFVNLTDAQGLPNPSFCGDVLVSFGPLEVGTSQLSFECPGCVTELLLQSGELFTCAGSQVVDSILSQIAPEHVGKSVPQLEADLSDEQKLGFLAALFSQPPGAVPDLAPCFFAAISNSWDAFQPQLVFCSSAQPKLFGMPMGSEISSAAGQVTKTNLVYTQGFSPSYMLLTLLQMQFFPAADSATFGVGLNLPDAGEVFMGGLSGTYNSPAAIEQHLLDGFQMFLEEATFTIGYEFTPFGLKMVNAEARVIMPSLTNHPAFRVPGWQQPAVLGYPSRLDLLLSAANADLLDDPFWKGTDNDLHLAFPEGSPERGILESNMLSFAQDYFPHGGVAGAATLTLPPAIADAPPEFFFTEVLNPATEIITRLTAMKDYVEGYILNSTSQVGSLAFYLPAPNPPSITDSNGMPLSVIEVMEEIKAFDVANVGVGSLYPVEASFLRGYLEGRLVGIPIVNGEIVAIPGDPSTGSLFQVSADIPPGSWFQDFVDSANLEFVMRSSPTNTIETTFTGLQQAITNALATSNNVEAVVTDVYNSLADGLPKTSFELAVNNLQVPDYLTNFLTASSASASFHAYSPRFEPGYIGNGPVAKARREGGIAFSGQFNFADLVQIDNAELGITPNPLGEADLAGQFDVPFVGINGLGLHDGLLDFDTDPDPGFPFFKLEGELDPINLGSFFTISNLGAGLRIHSLVSASLDTNGVAQGAIEIDPARLTSSLFGPTFSVNVHGATTNDPFTFSTDGPWTASLTLGGALELTDGISTNVLLSITGNTNFTAQLSATGLASGTLSMTLPTGVILTAFPGEAWEQVVELGLGPISLAVSSDGTFELSGSAAVNLALNDLPVTSLSAGGTVLMTESSLELAGEFSGGFLAENGGASATGSILIDATGGTTTFSASATLPPLQYGVFRVSGVNDTPLTVTVDNSGFAIPNGANLAVTGIADELLTLQAFNLNTNGNFNATVSSGGFVISNYFSLTGGNMILSRAAGVTLFDLSSPMLTLFPTEPWSNNFALPGVTMASTGEFLVDTGVQSLSLVMSPTPTSLR